MDNLFARCIALLAELVQEASSQRLQLILALEDGALKAMCIAVQL